MNMTTIVLLFVAIECIVLLLLGIMGKLTKRAFAAVAAISLVLAGFAALRNAHIGESQALEYDTRAQLYMGARLIEEGQPETALDALAPISDTQDEGLGIITLRALAYNLSGARGLACLYLERNNATEGDTNQKLYTRSLSDEQIGPKLRKTLCSRTIEAVAPTNSEREKWDIEMRQRYLGKEYLNDEENALPDADFPLLIRMALYDQDYASAYEKACEEVKDGSNQADVIVSQLYALGYDGRTLGSSDAEYDELLSQLTKCQTAVARAEMNSSSNSSNASTDEAKSSSEDQSLQTALANLRLAQKALDEAAAKRAIKYLDRCEIADTISESYKNLQMGYLYYLISDYDCAHEYLDKVFVSPDAAGSEQLTQLVHSLCDASIVSLDNRAGTDFTVAYQRLANALYSYALPDVYDPDYEEFFKDYLQELLGAIVIDSVNTSMWPQISVQVHSADGSLKNTDSLELTDSGTEITSMDVEKLLADESNMSICYVVDVSGSMSGSSIVDAREAVKTSTSTLERGMKVGLVSFSDDARIECGLVESSYMMASSASRLVAMGNTNIPAGINEACRMLESEPGNKAIILLSDGYDDNSAGMPDAVSRALDLKIPIYTVGLEGSDEEYLESISEETGGAFTFAANSRDLTRIYLSTRNNIRERFVFTFTAGESSLSNRYIEVTDKNGPARARKSYQDVSGASTTKKFDKQEQTSGLFRETGGTKEVGR